MPGDRDKWEGKALTTLEGSASTIYGYALGAAFESQILPSIAYYLVPLVGESAALASAEVIVAVGAAVGGIGLAGAGAAIVVTAALVAVAELPGVQPSAVSSGFDALGLATSPGTLALIPISPRFSPPDDPSLAARVWGPGVDLGLGVFTAGNPELLKVAGLGYGITATQSDYQVDEANLQNWLSSLTNGSAGPSPRPSPTPGPTPTPTPGPTPGPSSGIQQTLGSQGYVFPFDGSALGSGDLSYGSDEGSSYSAYSSYSSSFNGNGFTMTTTINVSGTPDVPGEPPFADAPPFDDGSPFNDAPPFDNHPFDNGFDNGFDNSFDNFDNSFDNNFDDE